MTSLSGNLLFQFMERPIIFEFYLRLINLLFQFLKKSFYNMKRIVAFFILFFKKVKKSSLLSVSKHFFKKVFKQMSMFLLCDLRGVVLCAYYVYGFVQKNVYGFV